MQHPFSNSPSPSSLHVYHTTAVTMTRPLATFLSLLYLASRIIIPLVCPLWSVLDRFRVDSMRSTLFSSGNEACEHDDFHIL